MKEDDILHTSLNSICEDVVAASAKVDCEHIKKLTDSLDGRLMAVIEKKGGWPLNIFEMAMLVN